MVGFIGWLLVGWLLVVLRNQLKKEVDSETKGKKRNPRKDNLPARIVEFPNDPANVETKAGRVTMNSANVQDATRKGGLAVIHGSELVGEPDKDNARAFDKLPV